MKNSKDLILYSLIGLLALGVIASDIALISKNKALQNSVSSMSQLKERYDSLNQSQQSEQNAKQTEKPTQQQVEEIKTTIRERTLETLDSRISKAKTEYEVGIFTEMKQRYTDIFDLSEKFRTAEGDERTAIRNSIAEKWIALGELYTKYNDYQWTSLAKEFGVTDTGTFMKRVEEIQAGFSDKENAGK